jgi:hypothetical protein
LPYINIGAVHVVLAGSGAHRENVTTDERVKALGKWLRTGNAGIYEFREQTPGGPTQLIADPARVSPSAAHFYWDANGDPYPTKMGGSPIHPRDWKPWEGP